MSKIVASRLRIAPRGCTALTLALAFIATCGSSAQAEPVSLFADIYPFPVERPTDGVALLPLNLFVTFEEGWQIVDYNFEKAYNDRGETLGFLDNPFFAFDLFDAQSNPGFTFLTGPGYFQVAGDSPYGVFDRNAPTGPAKLPQFSLTVSRTTSSGTEFFTATASYSFTIQGPVVTLPEPASIASASVAAAAVGAFGLLRRSRRGRAA